MSTAGLVGTPFPAPPAKDKDGDDDYLKTMKPKKLWEQEVRRVHGETLCQDPAKFLLGLLLLFPSGSRRARATTVPRRVYWRL